MSKLRVMPSLRPQNKHLLFKNIFNLRRTIQRHRMSCLETVAAVYHLQHKKWWEITNENNTVKEFVFSRPDE